VYQIMDDTLCVDRDIPTQQEAMDTCRELSYEAPAIDLPIHYTIQNQSTGEIVAEFKLSVNEEATYY